MDEETNSERSRPTSLRVNYRSSPSDVTLDSQPRFSWAIDDPSWGGTQSAYRLRLDPSPERLTDGDAMWGTGRVASTRSMAVPYDGPPLSSDATYHWTVTVWNDAGERSAPAENATFTTGIGSGWSGDWIARQPGTGDSNGHRSRWRDPDGDPVEWVQVDLGDEREIDGIELHPAEPFTGTETPDGRTITANDTEETYGDATVAQGPVAFGFPDRYRIEVSDDPAFEDARTVVDATETDQPDPRRERVVHDVDAATARHVRVVATSLDEFEPDGERLRETYDSWAVFALAALAVRDDGDDAARGRPVTSSSSVETEAWGRDRLTDGEYVSTMRGRSPLFRTEFELSKPVARARGRFVGLGYGELYVNGENATDDVLNPGWTQYDERVLYSTYDLTDGLHEGTNAVGVWLGRGWFARSARQWLAFGSPRARLHLTVEYEDGTTSEFSTGGDWRTAPSPIVADDVYDGETYDARRERTGWAEPGFDDRDWDTAAVATPPKGRLTPQRTETIEVTDTLEPVEIRDHEDGPIVDFGRNHTGWLSIDLPAGERGDEVVLRHAEALDDGGDLRTTDLRSADATDTYVLDGTGAATYEPRFTYHGYRYAQISGYPGELTDDDVRSKVVHTALPSTGEFSCSNDDLVGVQRNSRWGLRSNTHSVPTDCPQRDERMGFTGDGHIAARALNYNFDAVRFHRKWVRDHADTQSRHGYLPSKCPFGALPSLTDPTWTVSLLAIPWHLYRFHGDVGVLEDHYESMRRYVEFWIDVADGGLVPDDYSLYGDWLALENADGRRGEPKSLFTDAYYYRSVDLLSRIAGALGYGADAARYRAHAETIADAFNDRYFDEAATAYESGTQAACALPLFFGITPDEHAVASAETLARKVERNDDGQLRTGFLGTRPLLAVLTEYGYTELAYRVASQPEFPGWVYMLRQGATTVWERWDSDSEEHIGGRMNSLNHSPFTCISEWFYETLAGIDVRFGTDSYRIVISPSFVDDLSWAEGAVETPLGTVASRWETTDRASELTVRIPWNADARVAVPLDDGDSTVHVDGEVIWTDGGSAADRPAGIAAVQRDGRRVSVEVEPGSYEFGIE